MFLHLAHMPATAPNWKKLNTKELTALLGEVPPGERTKHPLIKVIMGRFRRLLWRHSRSSTPNTIIDFEDKYQTAFGFFIKAVIYWDPKRGEFLPYVTIAMKSTRPYCSQHQRHIKIPVPATVLVGKLRGAAMRYKNRRGCQATPRLAARLAKVDINQAIRLERSWRDEKFIPQRKIEEFPDKHTLTPLEILCEEEQNKVLEHAISDLNPRYEIVIRETFGINGTRTKAKTAELCEQMNASRQRVNQIRMIAIEQLGAALEDYMDLNIPKEGIKV